MNTRAHVALNFSATIEYVSATRAIVCMTDAAGAWSGALAA